MSEKEKDILLESSYDGIQEYDNDLPRWWLNIFWLTTVFAVIYMVYVHAGFRPTDEELLATRVSELQAKKNQLQSEVEPIEMSEQILAALVSSKAALESGHNVYVSKCAACHGQAGEGLIGPNLTDDYWIHGGTLMEIRAIIQHGVLDKGMLAWEGVLADAEINAVTAYIRSLRGTAPANAKAAQGELYEP